MNYYLNTNSAVEQLEMEIKKKKELIREETKRLEELLKIGMKLEREEVMGGEYRQLLHKHKAFHHKQAQVSWKNIHSCGVVLF